MINSRPHLAAADYTIHSAMSQPQFELATGKFGRSIEREIPAVFYWPPI